MNDGLQRRLSTHITVVARDRDPFLATAGHFYVQQYIQAQLSQWGAVEQFEFLVNGRSHRNLILNLPGQPSAATPRPPVLIGAHYDAVPNSPGADDNATGVAVLLELARSLTTYPARYPVRLVAFDLEEFGLQGSRQYATWLAQQGQPLRLMLSLEMLGYCNPQPHSQRYPAGLQYFYPNRGDFIALIGNLKTIPDLLHLKQACKRRGPVPCQWLPAGLRGNLVPDTRRSDHAPFWDAGYGAVMVTDTANLRNPHYHQSSDRPQTLDLEFLSGVFRGLLYGIQTL